MREARALLDAGHYAGAYYLCGYAVECALKARIARQTNRFDFPPDPDKVRRTYSHNLENLVKVAQLESELKQQSEADPGFQAYWLIVKEWSEQSRYTPHGAECTFSGPGVL